MGKARSMKAEEVQAHQYLSHCGYGRIEFEPDGSVPPDFLVDSRIAVEVRRLNQNKLAAGELKGLEEDSIPMWQGIRRLLPSLGPSTMGHSWAVGMTFERPVEEWRTLRPKIAKALEAFMQSNPVASSTTIQVATNFKLDLFPLEKDHGKFFVLGGSMDFDEGGFIIGEMVDNIRACMAEKAALVAPVRKNYPEWWLVLINKIDTDLQHEEEQQIKSHIAMPSEWKRVIVVNGRNPTRAFDL